MDINAKLESYKISVSQEYVEGEVATIIGKEKLLDADTYLHTLFSCIDLTTLNTADSRSSITSFLEKVNALKQNYPLLPPVASICIYPRFLEMAKKRLNAEGVNITVVSACFPSSQTFTEIKVAECQMAKEKGADEQDIVLSVGDILDGNYQKVYDEIVAIRQVVGQNTVLKVILETGELKSLINVKIAAIIAIEAGADFIKTSTGKVPINATPEATFVMCNTIKAYFKETGRLVGLKVAGGIASVNEALQYATLFSHILGVENLNKKYFRIGASRLLNNMSKEILTRKEIAYKSPIL